MEDAQARRERLRALREAAQLLETPEEGTAAAAGRGGGEAEAINGRHEDAEGREAEEEDGAQHGREPASLSFRNYLPRDEALQQQKRAPATLPKFQDPAPVNSALLESVDEPITTIAPKKENWDLRRDVAKRLEKLERRTQRAMIQLMQEEEERRRREEEEAERVATGEQQEEQVGEAEGGPVDEEQLQRPGEGLADSDEEE